MATVCVRVQSAEKCLVSWTIFQIEDNSLSLLELFENIKNGRVSISNEVPTDVYPLCSNCMSKEHVKKRSK